VVERNERDACVDASAIELSRVLSHRRGEARMARTATARPTPRLLRATGALTCVSLSLCEAE
jgi:hypothetical protein